MNDITIGAVNAGQGQSAVTSGKSVKGTGFSEVFKESINAVADQQNEAKKLAEGLLSGEHSNIHETMIAMEKASISFKMLTKVQTKVIEAYQEVMRLQL
jgi:flagellar hook-basal body complex protein FliE